MKCLIDKDGSVSIVESSPISPDKDKCVFAVKACGICGSDIPRVFGGTSYYYPIVLGHEFAGFVKDSENKDLIGRKACVFPILPCQNCEACKKEQWAMCASYSYYGSRRDGGMQSELLIKEENLIFLPDNVSFESGAMIEPTAVCLHAMKKAEVTPNSSVLIYGTGTIGLLCAMWAKHMGARHVSIFDTDYNRMSFARSLGFECYDNGVADIVIEASGAVTALNDAIKNCREGGKIVLLGHGHHDVTLKKESYAQILRKQLTIVGSWNSDHNSVADDWMDSISAISAGDIQPEVLITHKIPLENGDDAFSIIRERKEFYNKIMLVM